MSRKSVVLNNGKEVAFGIDKFPYGYYLQVFGPDDIYQEVPLFEAEGLTNGQWFKAFDKALDESEGIELECKAKAAMDAIAGDLDINGEVFNGDLNVRSL